MIVCLEGPSAVGKTTTCRALEDQLGAFVVPEVNALFERPHAASDDWYLERQVDRHLMAEKALKSHPFAVLDGDVFQPFWYNWSFGFQGWQSLESLNRFYRPLIVQGSLRFPDAYFHLVVGEEELRRRKEADTSRSRRGFDNHLCLMDTQPSYFAAMTECAPGLVHTVQAVSILENVRTIEMEIRKEIIVDHLSLFDYLVSWLADRGELNE